MKGIFRAVAYGALCSGLIAISAPAPAGESVAAQETREARLDWARQPEAEVYAAGQPTAEQVKEMAQAGIKTVIDLRTAGEDRGYDEPAAVRAAGMVYLSLPVSSDNLDGELFETFIAEMSKARAEGPVMVHCASSNRVGALYAAWVARQQELPVDEAVERGKAAGLRSATLEAKVRTFLEEREP